MAWAVGVRPRNLFAPPLRPEEPVAVRLAHVGQRVAAVHRAAQEVRAPARTGDAHPVLAAAAVACRARR
ncbi:hypothetical protein ALI44B_11805 [Leifsonia sp. ALI-44-B]|jgi:hypothetical protein|nr:hypothetical protein ALI44B_11805 [Leifsonia sp. ALI-44-B]